MVLTFDRFRIQQTETLTPAGEIFATAVGGSDSTLDIFLAAGSAHWRVSCCTALTKAGKTLE